MPRFILLYFIICSYKTVFPSLVKNLKPYSGGIHPWTLGFRCFKFVSCVLSRRIPHKHYFIRDVLRFHRRSDCFRKIIFRLYLDKIFTYLSSLGAATCDGRVFFDTSNASDAGNYRVRNKSTRDVNQCTHPFPKIVIDRVECFECCISIYCIIIVVII